MFNQYPYINENDLNLDWLLNAYKKLLADLAEIQRWIDEDAANYNAVLGRINALEIKTVSLQNQINAHLRDFQNYQHAVDVKFEDQKRAITAEYTALYRSIMIEVAAELTRIRVDMNSLYHTLVQYSDAGDAAVRNYVDATLQTFIQNLPDYNNLIIYNPVRGQNTIVQDAINDLYNYFNAFGLSAYEYDSMGLTAQEYDDYELTANEYDSWGRELLPFPDPNHYMRDPFTGLMAKFSTVIMELFGLHRGGLTAQEYDDLELTANDYDGREIPAYIYDMIGVS